MECVPRGWGVKSRARHRGADVATCTAYIKKDGGRTPQEGGNHVDGLAFFSVCHPVFIVLSSIGGVF